MDKRFNGGGGAVTILLVLTIMAFGCGEPTEVQDVPEPVERSRVIVEAHLPKIDDVMVEAARKKSLRTQLKLAIEEEAARPFEARVEDGLRYSTVFQREYVEGGLGVIFVDERGLTPRGERVVATLKEAERHALDLDTLHRQQIEALHSTLADDDGPMPVDDGFTPGVAEVEALVVLVAEALEEDSDENGISVIVDAVSQMDDGGQGPEALRRFGEYNQMEAQHFSARARLMVDLELRVADGLLRYAREMRHKNMERVDWREMRDIGGSTEVILQRMQATLRDVAEAELDEVDDVLQGLEPSHPQYRKLLYATDRYREFVEEGGWERVRTFRVEEGARSAHVEALRERLEAEGIVARPAPGEESVEEAETGDSEETGDPEEDEGEVEDVEESEVEEFDPQVVDETLIEGIRQYQKTHQFVPDGDPTPGFWRSINISAESRLEQLELTLQRWRESAIEDDKDFIMVNVPDFHVEVWSDGERQMRIPVVVGHNRRHCDPDTEQWVYPDKTPVVMAKMDHLMLNPPWYVPRRIVEQTLMPRVEANEDYFEEEGYEVVELANGREAVRQLPGPDNALGRVKFIFPNEHNVYLHDTPQQQFFEYGIRAFSHGCIRVSKPMELAEFLLEWMGRDDVDVDEVIESERTLRYNFEQELPVFVEYYTVWVNDDGDPVFLADIYRKDARRRAEDPDEFMRCTPPVAGPSEEEVPEVEEGEDEEEEPEDLEEDLGP